MLKVEQLWDLLADLSGEVDESVPVVSLRFEGGGALDVFQAERVRRHPIAWRVRGFSDRDSKPSEVHGVLLGTTDGRAMLLASSGSTPEGGSLVTGASRETRALADLAEVIARAIRRRFE